MKKLFEQVHSNKTLQGIQSKWLERSGWKEQGNQQASGAAGKIHSLFLV